jgi:hypothetical protein
LQEGYPSNKEKGPLTKKGAPYAIPLNNLKVKIKIWEATDGFKNNQRFIF